MNINKCALFEIKSCIVVLVELYCSMKGLSRTIEKIENQSKVRENVFWSRVKQDLSYMGYK